MTKKSGVIKQPFAITVNVDLFLEYISELVTEGIEGYFAKECIKVEDIEKDFEYGNDIVVTGNYKTEYTSEEYPQTYWNPGEYSEEREIKKLELEKIEYYLRSRLPDFLKEGISINSIDEDRDAEYKEYDIYDYKDPDTMVGGHDFDWGDED